MGASQAQPRPSVDLRVPRGWGLAYVAVVAALATIGFATRAPQPILLAAALSLPASILALPGFYVVYGLLAAVTGATSGSSSGHGYSTPDGVEVVVESGLTPAWFTVTTSVLGVAMLTAGAMANLYLVGRLRRARHTAAG